MERKRQLNIDLLRILVMFYVLAIHANYIALPQTTSNTFFSNPIGETTRLLIEFAGACAVNVFVLISGWFGIHPTLKKVLNLIFQVLFFWLGIYIILVVFKKEPLSISGLSDALFFSNWDWFVKAYLVLMIISPVLNAFLENASSGLVRKVLLCFFIFEFSYGWLGGAFTFFCGGYGTLSFIGLYLLSGYLRRLKDNIGYTNSSIFSINSGGQYLIIYILLTILGTSICIANFYFEVVDSTWLFNLLLYYDGPLMVASAVSLFLFFSSIKIQRNLRCVSFVSASTFAVFLFHSEPHIRKYFIENVQYIFNSYEGLVCFVFLLLYLVFVYILSLLLDQGRIFLWSIIENNIINKLSLVSGKNS